MIANRILKTVLHISLLSAVFLALPGRAQSSVVTTTADSGAGSLRAAVAGASAGGLITFDPSLAGQAIVLASGPITLSTNITIDGSALTNQVQINGGGLSQVFTVSSGATVTLNSLTITNGNAGYGAGGGIYNAGTLALNQCLVIANMATNEGGGVYNGGDMTVSNSSFARNSSTSATEDGGGIHNSGTLTVSQCTFTENSANGGGAIYSGVNSVLTVQQSTICSNVAFCCGGGITLETTNGAQTLVNSIVAGNLADNAENDFFGKNFTVTNNIVTKVNPLVEPLGYYGGPTPTMPPKSTSPAVAKGSDASAAGLLYDQRGLPRFSGGHVDIGAVETQSSPKAPTVAIGSVTGQSGTTATLNGTVAPNGAAAAWYFQYGLTTSYGAGTATNILAAVVDPATAGVLPVSANLTNLLPATIYHCRLVASNSVGKTVGADLAFHTSGFTNVVSNTNDNNHTGSLRFACANAVSGDFVQFAASLSGALIRLTNGAITLSNSCTIDGSTLAKEIRLSGNKTSGIFVVASGVTNVLNFLIFTNGYSSEYGGALENDGTVTINNCAFAGNSSGFAGGALENSGTMTVSNCVVSDNSSYYVGGIVNFATLTVEDTVLAKNSASAGYGGALYNNGTMSVNLCSISNNVSTGSAGGGIYNNSGDVTINDTTVANNSATDSGGIYNLDTLTLNNSTVSGNSAEYVGGIENAGTLTVNNSTVTGNGASYGYGGGIYSDATVTLNNTTVEGNSCVSTAGGGMYNDVGSVINLTNSIICGNIAPTNANFYADSSASNNIGTNLIDVDAQLAPLGNYGGPTQTMPPIPGSPAIDAGADYVTNFLAGDQRGFSRLIGAHVDLGAVEANPQMLIVLMSGRGAIAPDYNGQILTNGEALSMKATASPTFVFTNWSAGTNLSLAPVTNGATLEFMMQPNLVLQATFADLTAPTLSITNIPAGSHVSNDVFTVEGKAADNAGLSAVFYRLTNSISDSGWLPASSANNFTNWYGTMTGLAPGTNSVLAYAVDTSNNRSLTNTVKFRYILSATLSVSTNGSGHISPDYNNALLAIGSNYTMTATAASGFAFTNWTDCGDNVITNKPTLIFQMASNLCLVANFVDVTPPTLKVTAPTSTTRASNVTYVAYGTATDNVAVASVMYQFNHSGVWTAASGTTNWNVTLTLTSGTNYFSAYAVDTSNNHSATNTVKFLAVLAATDISIHIVGSTKLTGGAFQFNFTSQPGASLEAYSTTNLSLPASEWKPVGAATESPANSGQFQVTDPQATNAAQRFYRISTE